MVSDSLKISNRIMVVMDMVMMTTDITIMDITIMDMTIMDMTTMDMMTTATQPIPMRAITDEHPADGSQRRLSQ